MKNNILLLVTLWIIQVYPQCYSKISSGEFHTIAVTNNGSVNIWGYGTGGWGALGQGNEDNLTVPTPLNVNFNGGSVYAGAFNTFIIKTDGTLWAAGNDQYGQLGDGTYGFAHVSDTFIQIGTASDWKFISAGLDHTLAIKNDGTLWAWGYNFHGHLGDGTYDDRHRPVQIGTENNWKTVATGLNFSIAIKTDGTLWGWGFSSVGSIGLLTNGEFTSPTRIGTDNDWKSIAVGKQGLHTLALKNSGALYVFGSIWSSGIGALGLGENVNFALVPTQIGTNSDWRYISAGFNNSFGIKNNGTLWGWGQNDFGQLGDGTTQDKVLPTQIGSDDDWSTISEGYYHTVGLKNSGGLYTWGDNTYAQLGTGNYLSIQIPNTISNCILGAQQFQIPKISISPNPATEEIHIDFRNDIMVDKILIYDIVGRLVSVTENITAMSITIPISNYSRGLYTIVIKSDNQIISSEKLIKK